jgi:hypothetical protein
VGVTCSIPETRRLLELCLEEVVAVASARKIPMSATAIADTMKFYDGLLRVLNALQSQLTFGVSRRRSIILCVPPGD